MKKLLLALAALLVALAVIVATRPSTYRVEREARVAAPPAVVWAQVADFRRWDLWSPWQQLDPSMRKEYEGPPSGRGAGYHWSGNDRVGEGRMTITHAVAPEALDIQLDFIRPWRSTNETSFRFAPDGGGTHVTWIMRGEHDFFGKAFSIFSDVEHMVGTDFEKGLAALKDVSEAEARRPR